MSNQSDAANPGASGENDHDEQLRVAYQHLDAVVTGTPSDDTAAWSIAVQEATREVFTVVEQHRLLFEAEQGPLAELSQLKPGLVNDIERRQREHLEMLHRAKEIEIAVERAIAFDDFDPDLLRLQARVLHDILRLHLIRANALVYEAYFRDEGGEDG